MSETSSAAPRETLPVRTHLDNVRWQCVCNPLCEPPKTSGMDIRPRYFHFIGSGLAHTFHVRGPVRRPGVLGAAKGPADRSAGRGCPGRSYPLRGLKFAWATICHASPSHENTESLGAGPGVKGLPSTTPSTVAR
jgi:hypothetical protein